MTAGTAASPSTRAPAGPAHGVLRPRRRTRPVKPRCSAPWHPDVVVEPRFRWIVPGAASLTARRRPAAARHAASRTGWPASWPRRGVVGRGATSTPGSPTRSTACTTRRSCPTPTVLLARLTRARDRRRAGPRLRRLRCGRADRARDHDPRPAPVRRRRRARTCRAGSTRATACRWRRSRRPSRPGRPSSSPSTAARRAIAEIAERARPRHRRHRHGPPPRPAGPAAGARARQPAPARLDLPGPRLAGSGVAFKVAQLLLADEPGGAGRGARPGGPGDDRDRRRRRPDRRREPGDRAARAWSGSGRAPRPGHRRAARACPGRAGRRGPRDRRRSPSRPRLNAAGRVGEALEAARLLLAEDAAEAADPRRRARGGEPRPARPHEDGRRRGARARRRRDPAAPATLVHGPWPVGIVGLVAARLAEDRGRPAVVGAELGDVIRASCRSDGIARPRRDPRAVRATCSSATAAMPARPASSSPADRWDAFRDAVPGPRRRRPRRADPRVAARDRPRAPRARRRLRAATASSPAWRRPARATPSRSSPSSA